MNASRKIMTVFAATSLAMSAMAGANLSADGKTLTLSAASGETLSYSTALPATVTTIVKTGAGRYNLAPSSSSFTGTVDVREGTLGGDETKIPGTTKWLVADGASLLMTALSETEWYTRPTGALEIGGTGVNGGGAVQMPSLTRHVMFGGGTKLTSDALATGHLWGFKDIDMGGHDLYVRPTSRFQLMEYPITNPGNIHVLSQTIMFQPYGGSPYPVFSGNQKYIFLSDGTTANFYSLPAARPLTFGLKSTSGTVSMNSGNSTSDSYSWKRDQSPITGPVEIAGTLKVNTRTVNKWGSTYKRGFNFFGPVSVGGELNYDGTGFMTFHGNPAHDFGQFRSQWSTGLTTFTNTTDNIFRGAVNITGGRVEFIESGPNARTEFRGKVAVGHNDGTESGAVAFENAGYVLASAAENVVGGGTNAVAPCISVSGATLFTVPEQPSFASSAAATNMLAIGKNAGTHGILAIGPGGVVTNDVAVGGNGSGAIHITGGRLYTSFGAGNDGSVGATYGFIGITNGTFETKGFMWLGNWGGRGLLLQKGGTARFTAGPIKIGRTGAKAMGSCYVSGGTLEVGTSIQLLNSGSPAAGTEAHLTVDGEGALVKANGVYEMAKNGSGAQEFVNLNNGGVIETEQIRRYDTTDVTAFYLNFNGGVFRAKASVNAFLGSSFMPTRVTAYAGGAVIDTQGYNVTWPASIVRPEGGGIASIDLPAGITNAPSVGPGAVRIASSGSGTGASAVMDYDMAARRPTRVIVTSPGCGYEAGTTTVEVEDSSLNTYSATFAIAANATTGGLTKRGSGTLTLTGANTYGGATRIEGGTVVFSHTSGYPGGDLEVSAAVLQDAPATPLVQTQSLTFSAGCGVRLTEADTLDPSSFGAAVHIATSETPFASVPPLTVVDSDGTVRANPGPWALTLANGGRTLRIGIFRSTMVIIR